MKIRFFLLFLLCLLFLVLGGVLTAQGGPAPTAVLDETSLTISDDGAEVGTGTQTPVAVAGDVGIWDFVRMLFILGVVVGLIYVFLYFMKKAGKIGSNSLEGIQILGTQMISGSRALYVVDVAGEVLLLGAGDASITLIKEITDPEVRDALRLQASKQQETAKTGFNQILQKFMKNNQMPLLSADSEKTSVDFLKKQRERLKKL